MTKSDNSSTEPSVPKSSYISSLMMKLSNLERSASFVRGTDESPLFTIEKLMDDRAALSNSLAKLFRLYCIRHNVTRESFRNSFNEVAAQLNFKKSMITSRFNNLYRTLQGQNLTVSNFENGLLALKCTIQDVAVTITDESSNEVTTISISSIFKYLDAHLSTASSLVATDGTPNESKYINALLELNKSRDHAPITISDKRKNPIFSLPDLIIDDTSLGCLLSKLLCMYFITINLSREEYRRRFNMVADRSGFKNGEISSKYNNLIRTITQKSLTIDNFEMALLYMNCSVTDLAITVHHDVTDESEVVSLEQARKYIAEHRA